MLGYTDVTVRNAIENARASINEACRNVTVVNCLGQTSGTALNTLVAAQSSDAMLIADGLGALPQFGFFPAARQALSHRPSALFTTFFSTDDTMVGMPLGGDVASQILTSRAYGGEVIALRKELFDVIGSFEPYDARHGIVHEYVTRAAEAGHDLLVLPSSCSPGRPPTRSAASSSPTRCTPISRRSHSSTPRRCRSARCCSPPCTAVRAVDPAASTNGCSAPTRSATRRTRTG